MIHVVSRLIPRTRLIFPTKAFIERPNHNLAQRGNLHICSKKGELAISHSLRVPIDMSNVDLSEYEHYWSKEEDIPGLDLGESWTSQSMLTHIHTLMKEAPPLLQRNFKQVHHGKIDCQLPMVKVMQWNILAQALSTGKDNFVRCPEAALMWGQRRLRLLEGILTAEPDVLCMQEVDHYAFFKQTLGALGYSGVFFPKPDSPALYTANSNGPDGCAIFYNTAKLDLLKKDNIVLKKVDESHFTNQVCILMTLKTRCDGKQFTVATTHLKARTGWHDLRHSQGQYLLNYMVQQYPDSALIVCGDFNAELSEPVYQAFAGSSLGLTSAYKALSGQDEEPEYTTWKIRGGHQDSEREVSHTIDYMWFSKGRFTLHSLQDIPSGDSLGPDRLPSFAYPSDHLSLAAEFHIL